MLVAGTARSSFAVSDPEITLQASLRFEAPQIDGTLLLRWRNDGPGEARFLRFLLYANRFRHPPRWSSLSRHHLLVGGTFAPGGTEVITVREGDRDLLTRLESAGDLPAETILSVDLGRPRLPGEEITVEARFHTTLPNLLDVFGATDGLVVADRGWYPLPLSLDAADAPRVIRPQNMHTRALLSPARDSDLLVNGERFRDRPVVEREAAPGEDLSLLLSRRPLEVVRLRMGNRRVTVFSVPNTEIHHRVSRFTPPVPALLETLVPVVERSHARGDLTFVRAPLHWYPSKPATGMIFLSDRLFEVFPVLRPFHQREVAYAVYLQEELDAARTRESEADALWVAEGLAWRRAEELYRERFRGQREVRDWIRLFDVFAIVDRFETAPRAPFIRAFFPVRSADDPLRLRLESWLDPLPPGREIFSKIEARLQPDTFATLLARVRAGAEPFRRALRAIGGTEAETFLQTWLGPIPEVNYSLENVTRNPQAEPGAHFEIARESEEPRPEAVEVELEEGNTAERFFVNVDQSPTAVDLHARSPVRAVTLDPDRRLIETRLDDNRRPSSVHLLLDSADVEVSSTEFGVSTLLVGRRRYDYRKDLATAVFLTNRGTGANAGFQLHGGAPIDRNFFRQNLFAYYSIQELDSSFRNRQKPEVRTAGRLAGLGLRFNYYDAFWFENPSGSRHLRVFLDGYDRSLGGDFGFVQGGASLALTAGLRDDTVLAAQLLNGFTAPTGGRPIPNQGLFSLGGFRSIRGIGAEEELGRDIFIVRAEIRHLLPFRFDLNLEDLLVARRLQVKAFVDAGRVRDNVRGLYAPAGYAVGVGGGVNLFYDFFGFFPTSAYLDVATRADRSDRVQVLFGMRQPF